MEFEDSLRTYDFNYAKFRHIYFVSNYAPIRDNYILFYYEGENPQNQYHGFHISKKNAIKKIPNSILKRLRKEQIYLKNE